MKQRLVLLALVGAIGGGVVYWRVFGFSWPPNLSKLALPSSTGQVLGEIDNTVAEGIRALAAGKITIPDLNFEAVSTQLSHATVSATVSTTPAELWQSLREEGAAAVASDLAKSAQVQVGDVTLDVVSQARYQYCVGVVQEYEQHQ